MPVDKTAKQRAKAVEEPSPSPLPTTVSNAEASRERRSREAEIDVLVAHECATCGPVSRLIWERVRWPTPTPAVKVERQPHPNGREVDIRVSADGLQLLIEDKAAGGQFQPGQVEHYERMIGDRVRTVLVAPESFLKGHALDARRFSAAVSLEEMAKVLAVASQSATGELQVSYKHRSEVFETLARDPGWVGNPNVDVGAFGDCYRALAAELAGDRVELTAATLRNAAANVVEFRPWAPGDDQKPFHKLREGVLDVRLKGWRLGKLSARLSSLSRRRRPPKGWEAAAQKTSSYPVLRYRVESVEGQLSAELFESTRPAIVPAVRALSSLREWLGHGLGE